MTRRARAAILSSVIAMAISIAPPIVVPAAAAVTSATLTSSVGNALDGFARDVATSGDIVVAGAPRHDVGDDVNSNEGAVFVYQRGSTGWTSGTELAILTASDAAPGDQLGWAVAISGDVIAASAIRANGGAGAVYVFVKPAGGWASMTESAYLRSSTTELLSLGGSLAMVGDMIVAGAPSHDVGVKDDVGAALVFEKPASGWGPRSAGDVTESLFLSPSSLPAAAQFGTTVGASGSTVAVGAPGESVSAGAAYVFKADLTIGWSTLTLLARLTASDGGSYDGFGTSIAVRGRFIAIGAPCHDDVANSFCSGLQDLHTYGALYVYREPFTGWVSTAETAELQASSPRQGESLGMAVAINDDGIYGGAPGYSTASSFSGRVYRFVQPSGGWTDTTEASFEFQQRARFGRSLAGAGHTLAIGDASGNHGGAVTVEVRDDSAPTTSISVSPEAPDGPNDTYATSPTLIVTATDGFGTGVASIRCVLDPASVPQSFDDLPASCPYADPGLTVDTEGSHTLYAASIDVAGNASAVVSASVTLGGPPDTVPPTTSIALTPDVPDGSNGWYVSPVGVTVSATDTDSTVAETRCAVDPATAPSAFADLPPGPCSIGTITADGAHVIYAASVDGAGNTEHPLVSTSVRLDLTDPTLDSTLNVTIVTLYQTGVVASPVAADTTSDVANSSCEPVDTTLAGPQTVVCTATDEAGNTASDTIDYVVEYRMLGFFSPIRGSRWLPGQTVPIKVALTDANGIRISDGSALALANACRVTFSASGAQSISERCLRYDALTHQFVFNWKLGKGPTGAVTIQVSVSYPGSTTTTSLTESITIGKT